MSNDKTGQSSSQEPDLLYNAAIAATEVRESFTYGTPDRLGQAQKEV